MMPTRRNDDGASMVRAWPTTEAALEEAQIELALVMPPPWTPAPSPTIAGVWFTAPRGSPGDVPGEPAWAAAASLREGLIVGESVVRGRTGADYQAGLLALREGPLLERAVLALPRLPDAVVVNATRRDHPRGAGLAIHLGAVLRLPTVGVTDRPLRSSGAEPGPDRWSSSDLTLEGEVVAVRLRTRRGTKPVVVHAGWRTDLGVAVDLVRRVTQRARTPEPLRAARRLARLARSSDRPRHVGSER